MKQLLPILLFVISLTTLNNANAQFVVNVNVINCSGPAICDGSASIDSTNNLQFTALAWYMNGTLIQNGGTSIFNLCTGN
ncbi:MAG: hypothetical protein FJ349_07185 [Sphingomonadales bacterium]|nr:hypothetical protein [Sphingomonadales bacterium]